MSMAISNLAVTEQSTLTMQWNTFLNGEAGYRIVLDGNNNIYVTGLSSDTWVRQ